MTVTQVLFYTLAILIVGGSLLVVLSKDIVHCALSLVLAFSGLAGLYILLDAEFLAAVQVLIYVGGITILFLFAIMLTSRASGRGTRILNEQVGIGAAVALILVGLITYASVRGVPPMVNPAPPPETTPALGRLFMTAYALPFEAVSILLLAAMVGAIVLARKERE